MLFEQHQVVRNQWARRVNARVQLVDELVAFHGGCLRNEAAVDHRGMGVGR